MNSNDNKSPELLNDLEGIREILDEEKNDNEKNSPVLDESIPMLNQRVDINKPYSVSLDPDKSTETIEQQNAKDKTPDHPASEKTVPELTEKLTFSTYEAIYAAQQKPTELVLEDAWIKVEMLLMEN